MVHQANIKILFSQFSIFITVIYTFVGEPRHELQQKCTFTFTICLELLDGSRLWSKQQCNNNLPIGQNQMEQGLNGTKPNHHKMYGNDTCKSL